jgi:hypothetical protein
VQGLRNQPRDEIEPAAGRVGDYDAYGLGGKRGAGAGLRGGLSASAGEDESDESSGLPSRPIHLSSS